MTAFLDPPVCLLQPTVVRQIRRSAERATKPVAAAVPFSGARPTGREIAALARPALPTAAPGQTVGDALQAINRRLDMPGYRWGQLTRWLTAPLD